MNYLIVIGSTIATIIILLLIIALFSRKSYRIERSIIISKPISDVFNYLRHIKNQDYYNKWVMRDPNMQKSFTGTDGTKGFIYAWDGNKQAGAGEQEIRGIENNKRVEVEIRFVRPFKGIAYSTIETESPNSAPSNSTAVKWSFTSKMNYPLNIFLVITSIEKQLGKDLESSLVNLKAILEK
jgi:hypothetical protein